MALTIGSLGLALASAIAGWQTAAVVLLVISILGEWFMHRDAPKAALLLHQASFGIPMRFVIRVVAGLFAANQFDGIGAIRTFAIGAIVYALLLCARALHTEYYLIGPLSPMETKNIPNGPRIATEPPTHPVRLLITQWLIIVPALVGTPWYLVLAFSVMAITILAAASWPDARNTWRMRQQKRATGFTGPLRQLQDFINEYRPEVIVHLSGPETAGYQINSWLEALEALEQNVLIVIRDEALFMKMGTTTLPVIGLRNPGELMMLNLDPVKIALYPSNTGNNIHLLRLPYIMSAFIGHGDSDKSASNNPFSRAYDELWVAGEAGADRYRKSGLDIHESQYRHAGRPQVHAISQSPKLGEEEIPTLLYAPTWEGVNHDQEYSSVSAIGTMIISAALKSDRPVRIIYKPHPFTGQRDAKYRAVHAAIVSMIDVANVSGTIKHVVVGNGAGEPTINECFNESTAMIGDISSVVTDYLASEKPYAVFNHKSLDREAFTQLYPSAAAATIVKPDGDGIERFVEVMTQKRSDDNASARSHLAHYLLGPVEDRSIEAFQRAITTFIARSDAERAEYRTHR